MKQELLFRGEKIDDGKLIEGYGFVEIPEQQIYIIIHRQGINLMQHTEVKAGTIVQFTGKKDKNGVKIFNGDKVEYVIEKYDRDDNYELDRIKKKSIVQFEGCSYQLAHTYEGQFEWIDLNDAKEISVLVNGAQ